MQGTYCPVCDIEYDPGPDEPWQCKNSHPLELSGSSGVSGADAVLPSSLRNLWDFADLYPISHRVSLGEGNTPEVYSSQWDAVFKLEYITPSASFKDRGTTTMLSRALELGVTEIVDDSSGNAGSSIAQYAAHAGLSAQIFVPADVSAAKRATIESTGTAVIPVEGSREDVRDACVEAVNSGEKWYASHTWRPSFVVGTKSFAYEIAATRDWSVPDSVVLPLGAGTLFLGAYRGFEDLRDAGVIESIPRLLGAQAAGYAPIVDYFSSSTSGERNGIAEGLHTERPPRKEQIIDAIESTEGDVVAVSERATERALEKLHQTGFYVEPTAAVAPAATELFEKRGDISEQEEVVVALSGSGLNAV